MLLVEDDELEVVYPDGPEDEASAAATAPAVVIIGARNRKIGAAIRLVSKISIPCRVPPFVSVTMPRMNVTRRTGAAMSHVAKPMPGISDTRQVRPIISQLAMISPLGLFGLGCVVICGCCCAGSCGDFDGGTGGG